MYNLDNLDNQSSLDEVYGRIPTTWEKFKHVSDKGKDTLDIVESMQKGHIVQDN